MARNYKVNTGSKPNIPDGTILAVIFRDGNTSFGEVGYWDFSIDDVPKDIMFYKETKKQKYIRPYTPNKGSCPVPEETLVDVIFRDGTVVKQRFGSIWNWTEIGCTADIIFWRLSKSKKGQP